MLEIILYSWLIAVFSFTYRCILSKEVILNWWFMFGLRFSKKFFYRPIWGCEKCFAGQLTFWLYLLNWLINCNIIRNVKILNFITFLIPNIGLNDFNVLKGLFFISLSILNTYILNLIVKKIEND